MSTKTNRLRFDRRFADGTEEALMAEYIATYHQNVSASDGRASSAQYSDVIFETLEARFLPLASDQGDRVKRYQKTYRCIYTLESYIQSILQHEGIVDPRRPMPVLSSSSPSTALPALSGMELSLEEDCDDLDNEFADQTNAVQSVLDALDC